MNRLPLLLFAVVLSAGSAFTQDKPVQCSDGYRLLNGVCYRNDAPLVFPHIYFDDNGQMVVNCDISTGLGEGQVPGHTASVVAVAYQNEEKRILAVIAAKDKVIAEQNRLIAHQRRYIEWLQKHKGVKP